MLNQVSLIGNVGKVELTANNGKEFVNFTLAVNERPYKDKNGNDVNKTNWFRVAVFNEHLQKIVKNTSKRATSYMCRVRFKIRSTRTTTALSGTTRIYI